MTDDQQRLAPRPLPSDLLSYVAATVLAVPVGALLWFEAVYLYFGLTGEDPGDALSALAALLAFGFALAWPLHRAHRAAQVVWRACRLGLVISALLPVVAFAVLLIWQGASNRPDLGMGGLMLYALPYVALGVAAVLVIAFWLGAHFAGRKLRPG